ncbi:MAG: peptidase M19 [Flavobacterium sp.]|uniref:dipeptidase n=1 Tax=Flavobacterium sp. TaxID=239 RepID=UPI0011FB7C14|nr:membrane dipeptidase [Flavobacterium sp.]RZJ67041.1 MAG: peptidase M19 [Flavobacterium sp.]
MATFSNYPRRKFLAQITAAGTFVLFDPVFSWTTSEIDPRIAAIVAKTIGIDAHNHVDVPLKATELPGPKVDLAADIKKSGLSAICMTFAVDYQQLKNPGEAYERFLNGLTAMDAVLAGNDMKRALNLADLRTAHENKIPTVIQSVEGAHFLEGNLDRLDVAYQRGLRHLGLLHDNDASVPLGDVFTNPPKWGGLTKLGADTIRKCNELGILVDLSHGTNEMVNAALKVSKKPVLVSHTGLDTRLGKDEFMSKMMRPRLISKEQAKIVADTGGVIGVWTHLANTPLEYAENIKAMVDVVGIEHVCIGTDTKLTMPYRSPSDTFGGPKPQAGGQKPGNDKPGNKNDAKPKGEGGKRVGERTNEAWQDQKTGFYYTVVEAMLATGFSEDEIAKIGGGNYCRVFDAATLKG